jgi:hypothetical protein
MLFSWIQLRKLTIGILFFLNCLFHLVIQISFSSNYNSICACNVMENTIHPSQLDGVTLYYVLCDSSLRMKEHYREDNNID